MNLSLRPARGAALALAAALAACSGGKSPSAEPRLAGIQILPASATPLPLPAGVTVRLTAIGTFTDGARADVTGDVLWSSSAPAFATVSNAPGGAGVVTAVTPGLAEITATDPVSGATSRAALEIVGAQVVELAVAPIDPTLLVGTTLQLEADAILSDDTGVDLAASVTWTSSDPAVATVTQNGLVTAVAVGAASVSALDVASGISASTTVSVTAQPAALSYVAFSKGSIVGGGPVEVSGALALTSPAPEAILVALSSSDADVVAVPDAVLVPAGAQGASFPVVTAPVTHRTRVTLTATAADVTKTARLNVRVAR